MKYTLSITDEAGHNHMNLEVDNMRIDPSDPKTTVLLLMMGVDAILPMLPPEDRKNMEDAAIAVMGGEL